MKKYLAIYKIKKVEPFHINWGNSGFNQDDFFTRHSYRFEAPDNFVAKAIANKYKIELHELNSTFLGKMKITLRSGKSIKPPKLEELLEIKPVPIK